MNLILKNSKYVKYYTYLDEVFARVPEFRQYHWLISDLQLVEYYDDRFKTDPVVINGEDLNEIVQKHKIQFIWAVMSGFKEKIKTLPAKLPTVLTNYDFYVGSPKPQAPGAEVEIVCVDSSFTLFIGVNNSVATKLRDIYPDIKDLDIENEKKN